MAIQFGSNSVNGIYYGSSKIARVYCGANLTWESPGALTVNYSNPPSGAQWSIDGGTNYHDFGTAISLVAGTYTITYKSVSNYITPSNQSVTVTVGGDHVVTANQYVAYGTLRVNYSGTAPSGAQWTHNGGSTWTNFGSSVSVTPGTYTISYKAVSGYTAPSNTSATVTAGNTTTITAGAYTENASTFGLSVSYATMQTPPTGAAWSYDNGFTWLEFGTLVNLPPGTYTITYKPVANYTAPASHTFTAQANDSVIFTDKAYTAESIGYPNAFVVTGTDYEGNSLTNPDNSTENLAKVTGTYVKQSNTTTYNGTSYPIYYNGYYYMYKSKNDGYVALNTSMSSEEAGMPGNYSTYYNRAGTSVDMTSSSLGGTWSPYSAMPTSYITLAFADSTATVPAYGTLQYVVDTTKPYLNVNNSSTTTYNGNYYLFKNTASTNNYGPTSGSVWKHETENYWIMDSTTGSHTGSWYIYDSISTSTYGDWSGNKLASIGGLGGTYGHTASYVFRGGYTYNGYTTTYYNNQLSSSCAFSMNNYDYNPDNGWYIYGSDGTTTVASGVKGGTATLSPGEYKLRIYCVGASGTHTFSTVDADTNHKYMIYNMVSDTGTSPRTGNSVYYREYDLFVSDESSCAITATFSEQNACLVEGSMVTLADGTTKPVEEVTYDDELLVWDFDNGAYSSAKPATIKPMVERDTYFENVFEDGSVINTHGLPNKGHEFFDATASKFDYNASIVGHDVMTLDGAKKLVSSKLKWTQNPVKIYHIITKKHFNLFADGVLTSVRLNNLYPIHDMKYDKSSENIPATSEQLSQFPEQLAEDFRMDEQPAKNFDYALELSKSMNKPEQ